MLNRRDFLRSAVFGIAATAIPRGALASTPVSDTSPSDDVDCFEGSLIGASAASIDVQADDGVRLVPVGAATTVWKGGETNLGSLVPGDDVLVRVVGGTLDRAWANLGIEKGFVAGTAPGGYVLTVNNGDLAQDILLAVDDSTRWQDAISGQDTTWPADFPPGTWVQASGLAVADGLRAALLRYVLPGTAPAQSPVTPGPDKVRKVPLGPLALCNVTYSGIASLFDCANGKGRCVTCNTSNSAQLAWPHQDTCGNCALCCDCSATCKNQTLKSCGDNVSVVDVCSHVQRNCTIVDCGPCQKCKTCSSCNCSTGGGCCPSTNACCGACGNCNICVCSHGSTICVSRTGPVVDLTRPTFTVFRDPTQFMSFPCDATVSVLC